MKQKLQLITDLSLDKALTIARQHEQVKLQMREQQLEQEQHVVEARVSPSPRTAGRYTKPKDGHTASKYRYSMSRTMNRLTRKCERCGYAEHLRGGRRELPLRWDRGAINAMQKDILLRSVTL